MTYTEFIEKLKQEAHDQLDYSLDKMQLYEKGFTSDEPILLEWVRDTNFKFFGKEADSLLDDFLVLNKDESDKITSAQRIAVHRLFEDSKANGFDAVFAQVKKNVDDLAAAEIDINVIEKRLNTDYEIVRKNLIIRPLNYTLHSRELTKSVYRTVGDIVLVLYQLIGDVGNSLTTSKIQKEELETWGMAGQEQQVLDDALENTAKLFPACVQDYAKGECVDFLNADFKYEDIAVTNFIMLSTFRTTNGAVAMFYPGVADKLFNLMKGEFIAVFMNINDVLIFKSSNLSLAKAYAETAVESSRMGEMLSGNCYLCNKDGIKPFDAATK